MPSISLEIKLCLIIIKMVTMIKYYLVAAIASVFVWGFFHFFFLSSAVCKFTFALCDLVVH